MKYINLFDTQAAYDAAEKYYPNTSYIEASDEVVYQAIDPDYYSKQYLTFEALQNGAFTLTVPADVNSTYMTSVSYSIDDGANWVTTMIDNTAQTITTPTVNAGDKVLWKGTGKQTSYNFSIHSIFSSTGNFNVSGNIMSLLYGDNFVNQTEFASGSSYNFYYLFGQTTKLINAENLILPATRLREQCYRDMFYNCTALTKAPAILPATTLAQECYATMFSGCTSLTTAPELPATTLTSWCYADMFYRCTSLTTAPELPATTLVEGCYWEMYKNCRTLNRIKMFATDISATDCLLGWVTNVASSGIFTKAASMTTLPTGDDGIPSGWTVVNV